MPTKSATVILELIEEQPRSVSDLLVETDYARTTIQEVLAKFTSQGKLQRSKEEGNKSLYSIIENGRPQIRDWTKMREWRKDDGPIAGVFVGNKPGHQCEWSCTWLMPNGTHKHPDIPSDPEAVWWECQDIIARFQNVPVGAHTLVGAMAQARYPEDLEGAPLNVARQCLGVARSTFYSGMPYLHPTTIKPTGDRRFPLKLNVGGLKVVTGISFRPGWAPPGEVSQVLLKYARGRSNVMGSLNRLLEEEWVDIRKMAARFEEMVELTT